MGIRGHGMKTQLERNEDENCLGGSFEKRRNSSISVPYARWDGRQKHARRRIDGRHKNA